ncbi:MAG: polysaccharide export protein [Desulfovibrionaceae bacterium]|nr:polysaccharide export protein [Desulfovibrionaceae bacterium]
MHYSTFVNRALRLGAGCACIVLAPAAALAQTSSDLLNTSPRGSVQSTPLNVPGMAASGPAGVTYVTGNPGAPGQQLPLPPLPPNPATSSTPVIFGSQMFSGRFSTESFSGFNPDYQLTEGDRVSVRLWGAFNLESSQAVDAQGNIFIPNVGPVRVRGVRNGDLNQQVTAQIKRVFRSNVGAYASLEAAQAVKVFVTGFVRAPGLYGGLSSNTVLYYLDKAGGIDPDRGSFLNVEVVRNGQPRISINLYDFLLKGDVAKIQLHDGDSIVVHSRQHTVQVSGEVLNPYVFEFTDRTISAGDLLAMARPTPAATHLSIVRDTGTQQRSEYYPLAQAGNTIIEDGDQVTLTADKYPGTVMIRVEGANLSERTLVLPYGSRLSDAMARIRPAPQANMNALQLFRKSVAARQKDMLEASLRNLETYALTSRSSTSEEATLRTREAELILQFVERARKIEPRGQVILANKPSASQTLLENGDVLRVPERSNLVLVSGEVQFPSSLVYDAQASMEDYVKQAGGFTQNADDTKIIVLHQDGSVADAGRGSLQAGDEIMVLPKITSKRVEVTRGITQIIYQLAVAAKVALGL